MDGKRKGNVTLKNEREIKHVAMYLRISREKKGENVETLANHREILTEFVNNKGYTFVEFGEVISGGKTDLSERVQLEKLLNSIEQFDAILVIELSRLSRNGLISQTVKQYCIDYDVPIITPYEQIYDLANSDTDRLMFDVGSMISSHEHGAIGKRSKINKIQMVKSGLHVASVPFGYVRNSNTKKLEIDEEAAQTIRYIFELHGKGLGSYKIRDILNSEGYKSATGKAFNLPSIKRIIRNPHYKGWTVFHDRKRIKKGDKVTYEITDTITIENTHPAIIPPKEWDKANRDRIERAKVSQITREKPATKSEVTMLKDLIYCGVCEKKMTIRKDNKSATGYTLKKCEYLLDSGEKCPNCGVKIEFVEKLTWKKLYDLRDKYKKDIKEIIAKGENQVKVNYQQKIQQLRKRLDVIEKQEKKLIDLALSGLFTNDEIREKKQLLIDEKIEMEKQIDELVIEERESSTKSEVDKLNEKVRFIDELSANDPVKLNESLKIFIKKIHYTRVIPEDILKLSTRNSERRNYKFDLEFEYYDE